MRRRQDEPGNTSPAARARPPWASETTGRAPATPRGRGDDGRPRRDARLSVPTTSMPTAPWRRGRWRRPSPVPSCSRGCRLGTGYGWRRAAGRPARRCRAGPAQPPAPPSGLPCRAAPSRRPRRRPRASRRPWPTPRRWRRGGTPPRGASGCAARPSRRGRRGGALAVAVAHGPRPGGPTVHCRVRRAPEGRGGGDVRVEGAALPENGAVRCGVFGCIVHGVRPFFRTGCYGDSDSKGGGRASSRGAHTPKFGTRPVSSSWRGFWTCWRPKRDPSTPQRSSAMRYGAVPTPRPRGRRRPPGREPGR